MLISFAQSTSITRSVSRHKWQGFLFTLLLIIKKQGIDDPVFQPYSCDESHRSQEINPCLSLTEVQEAYERAMKQFPIQ